MTHPRVALLAAASLLAGACSPTRWARGRKAARFERAGLVSQQVQTGCCSVHTWTGGDGPPVLLLQGFGGDALVQWDRQVAALAAEHRLLVPDLVWFGASTSGSPPSIEVQVEAMFGLADALGVERFDVVGVSYGGLVATWMATAQPERVRRLVLVDSPGGAFAPGDLAPMLDRFGVAHPSELLLPEGPEDLPRLLSLVAPPPRLPGFILRDIHDEMFVDHRTEKRVLLDDLLNRLETAQDLPVPTQPTLVVWGAGDRVFPLSIAHRLVDRMPQAQLVVIPEAAHGPNVSHPEEFNAAVVPFLAE